MATERTLSIIKPDAVAKNVIGQIYARFESAGLKIVAARLAQLSRAEAEAFYAVHKARPFFNDLVSFMISGPVMIQVLEGEGAIARNRELMGATDPKKAEKGTIRADFADSIDANAVHGSDAAETAAVEILESLAAILAERPYPIRIEGHTDNRPIKTAQFPSNWELSAARASRIVRLFEQRGITASRMVVAGMGENQPLADNATPDGRNRNRRVALVILGAPPAAGDPMPGGLAPAVTAEPVAESPLTTEVTG